MPPSKPAWYAVYTRSRAEKQVAREFSRQGIEHYLPLQITIRQWSDRKKKVEVPLIRSYIFARVKPAGILPVLQVHGVVRILHFCGKPVPIPDWQIDNMKILMGSEVPVKSTSRKYAKGEEVCITRGSLQGLRGTITRVRNRCKLVIRVNALDYNLTVDIDLRFVEPVGLQESKFSRVTADKKQPTFT